MAVRTFRELQVWQIALDLVEKVQSITRLMADPDACLIGEPMEKAAIAVPSHIAAGSNRDHPREFLEHLSVARAALGELQTLLELSRRRGLAEESIIGPLDEQADRVTRMIVGLEKSLRRRQSGRGPGGPGGPRRGPGPGGDSGSHGESSGLDHDLAESPADSHDEPASDGAAEA